MNGLSQRAQIKTIGILGTGLIGASWAGLFLAAGYDVVASDPGDGAEQRLRAFLAELWPAMAERGLAADATLARLGFDNDPARMARLADFIQESVPEVEQVKLDLLRRIEPELQSHTVVASSTSSLMISPIQRQVARPDRLIIGHPFNPPHLIPVVEVVKGELGSEQSVALAMALYSAIGQRPIKVRREVTGSIANRIQAALLREAFHLVAEGVATVEDIDIAIAHGPGLRWALAGPFLNLHLGGGAGGIEHALAHLGPALDRMWQDLGSPRITPELTAEIVRQMAPLAGTMPLTEFVRRRDRGLQQLLKQKEALGLP